MVERLAGYKIKVTQKTLHYAIPHKKYYNVKLQVSMVLQIYLCVTPKFNYLTIRCWQEFDHYRKSRLFQNQPSNIMAVTYIGSIPGQMKVGKIPALLRSHILNYQVANINCLLPWVVQQINFRQAHVRGKAETLLTSPLTCARLQYNRLSTYIPPKNKRLIWATWFNSLTTVRKTEVVDKFYLGISLYIPIIWELNRICIKPHYAKYPPHNN